MERKDEGVWIKKQIQHRIRRSSFSRGDVENLEFRGKKLWCSKETRRLTKSKPNSVRVSRGFLYSLVNSCFDIAS